MWRDVFQNVHSSVYNITPQTNLERTPLSTGNKMECLLRRILCSSENEWTKRHLPSCGVQNQAGYKNRYHVYTTQNQTKSNNTVFRDTNTCEKLLK